MTERTGWAYGTTSSGQWLTIPGSAYKRPVLHPAREDAETALAASPLAGNPHMHLTVAHVTEVEHGGVTVTGLAYRITAGEPSEGNTS
jgi:hypothetical protein